MNLGPVNNLSISKDGVKDYEYFFIYHSGYMNFVSLFSFMVIRLNVYCDAAITNVSIGRTFPSMQINLLLHWFA